VEALDVLCRPQQRLWVDQPIRAESYGQARRSRCPSGAPDRAESNRGPAFPV